MTKLTTFLITLLVLGKCEGKYDKGQYLDCTANIECNIGLYCNEFPALEGESYCAKFCTEGGSCSSTAYCDVGKCAAKKQTGGSCFKSEECSTGLKCITSKCGYGKAIGEYCSSTNDCVANLVCNYYSKCDYSYSNGGDYGPYYGDDSESTFEKNKLLFVVLIVVGIVFVLGGTAVVVYYQRKHQLAQHNNPNFRNGHPPPVPNGIPVVASVVSNPLRDNKTRMPVVKTVAHAHTINNNQAPVAKVVLTTKVPVTQVIPTAPVYPTSHTV